MSRRGRLLQLSLWFGSPEGRSTFTLKAKTREARDKWQGGSLRDGWNPSQSEGSGDLWADFTCWDRRAVSVLLLTAVCHSLTLITVILLHVAFQHMGKTTFSHHVALNSQPPPPHRIYCNFTSANSNPVAPNHSILSPNTKSNPVRFTIPQPSLHHLSVPAPTLTCPSAL